MVVALNVSPEDITSDLLATTTAIIRPII